VHTTITACPLCVYCNKTWVLVLSILLSICCQWSRVHESEAFWMFWPTCRGMPNRIRACCQCHVFTHMKQHSCSAAWELQTGAKNEGTPTMLNPSGVLDVSQITCKHSLAGKYSQSKRDATLHGFCLIILLG